MVRFACVLRQLKFFLKRGYCTNIENITYFLFVHKIEELVQNKSRFAFFPEKAGIMNNGNLFISDQRQEIVVNG